MVILSLTNIQSYLERILPKVTGCSSATRIISSQEITEETYVNYIFRVTVKTNNQIKHLYLRQTRDHVKTRPERALSPDRIRFETHILSLIGQIQNDLVPEVLYLDKTNNVAVLSDIKRGCPLLVKELVAGRAHPEAADYFGKVLAQIHGNTLKINHRSVHGSIQKNSVAVAFHLGMRLEPAERMFPQQTKNLLTASSKSIKCLVLGDLASKNIFIDKNRIRFLDLERSFIGDPAFDLAFLFCHFLIEISPEKIGESLFFIDKFISSYRQNMAKFLTTADLDKLENRIVRFLGVTILYRLFGLYLVINVKRNKDYWTGVAESLLKNVKASSLSQTLQTLIVPNQKV